MKSEDNKEISIKNKLRKIKPLVVGSRHKTALIITAGVTKDYSTIEKEIKKIKSNLKYGIDMINDVTINSSKDIEIFQKKLIKEVTIPIKSVPGYELYLRQKEEGKKIITKSDLLNLLEEQAKRGVDAFTIHPFPTLKTLDEVNKNKRCVKLSARGGGLLFEYMTETGRENPFFEFFDEIVNLAAKYEITLSFGQSFRPSCLADRLDKLLEKEMKLHSQLAKRVNAKGVNTMVEILGHIRITDLHSYMTKARKLFPKTILTCMGPILTDISIGHDNITSAIGGVLAGMEGIDMIINITPDEHIRIPSPKAITEGIISHKIAAHIIDTWKIGDWEKDLAIGKLRQIKKQCFTLNEGKKYLIDPDNPNLIKGVEECTMCGDFCPRKKVK